MPFEVDRRSRQLQNLSPDVLARMDADGNGVSELEFLCFCLVELQKARAAGHRLSEIFNTLEIVFGELGIDLQTIYLNRFSGSAITFVAGGASAFSAARTHPEHHPTRWKTP